MQIIGKVPDAKRWTIPLLTRRSGTKFVPTGPLRRILFHPVPEIGGRRYLDVVRDMQIYSDVVAVDLVQNQLVRLELRLTDLSRRQYGDNQLVFQDGLSNELVRMNLTAAASLIEAFAVQRIVARDKALCGLYCFAKQGNSVYVVPYDGAASMRKEKEGPAAGDLGFNVDDLLEGYVR